MPLTGIREYDRLPARVGATDIEVLRGLYNRHIAACESCRHRLDELVKKASEVRSLYHHEMRQKDKRGAR